MPNLVYNGEVNLVYNGGDGATTIENERIEYIMIDYRYENVNVLPIVYIALKIPLYLHDKIISNYKSSTFSLTINRRLRVSKYRYTPVDTHISGEFNYVCSNKEQNSSKKINADGHDDRSYISTVIGLVSSDMMSALRSSFNDVYVGLSLEDLVLHIALGNLPDYTVIYSPLKNAGIEFEQFMVPPTAGRYKFLETIFERVPFYDTNFNFFMDFNKKVYLLEKNAEVPEGVSPSIINIYIESKEDGYSLFPGLSRRGTNSDIHVNSMSTKTYVNESVGQIANTLTGFDYDTGFQDMKLEESFAGIAPKTVYIKTDNAAVYRNEIVNSTVALEVYKTAVNPSVITPEKCYNIQYPSGSNYSTYNGRFILSYKQETYMQAGDGTFNVTCSMGFKKFFDAIPAEAVEGTYVTRTGKFCNGGAKLRSSADKETTPPQGDPRDPNNKQSGITL